MKKSIRTLLVAITIAGTMCMTSYATDFSSYWYQDGANWKIQDGSGNMISNAWVCDNAVTVNHNTDTNWYLMNPYGQMYEGIIQDQNGNCYLLNPNHDGTYGMMVTTNGFTYNGVTYQFDQNHDGTFGKILNTGDIARSGLSVTQVNTAGKPNFYTNDFMSSYSGGSWGSNSQTSSSQQSANVDEYGYSLAPEWNQPKWIIRTDADLEADKKAMAEYMATHDMSQITFY